METDLYLSEQSVGIAKFGSYVGEISAPTRLRELIHVSIDEPAGGTVCLADRARIYT